MPLVIGALITCGHCRALSVVAQCDSQAIMNMRAVRTIVVLAVVHVESMWSMRMHSDVEASFLVFDCSLIIQQG